MGRLESLVKWATADYKQWSTSWEGELRRDQWNLFSLKVLTRLGQADEATIKVKVAAKPKDSSVKDQLNQGLKDLGLPGQFEAPSEETPR